MKETAAIMGISTRTAESHKYEIMRLLGVETPAALIRYAVRIKLVLKRTERVDGSGTQPVSRKPLFSSVAGLLANSKPKTRGKQPQEVKSERHKGRIPQFGRCLSKTRIDPSAGLGSSLLVVLPVSANSL